MFSWTSLASSMVSRARRASAVAPRRPMKRPGSGVVRKIRSIPSGAGRASIAISSTRASDPITASIAAITRPNSSAVAIPDLPRHSHRTAPHHDPQRLPRVLVGAAVSRNL
jgi:hypothetical protein